MKLAHARPNYVSTVYLLVTSSEQPDFSVVLFTAAGSASMDLLREFKLLGEVLDLLESNLMVVGTQVDIFATM